MQPQRLLGRLDQRRHVGVLVVGDAQLVEDELGGRLDQGSGAADRLGRVGVHDPPNAVDVVQMAAGSSKAARGSASRSAAGGVRSHPVAPGVAIPFQVALQLPRGRCRRANMGQDLLVGPQHPGHVLGRSSRPRRNSAQPGYAAGRSPPVNPAPAAGLHSRTAPRWPAAASQPGARVTPAVSVATATRDAPSGSPPPLRPQCSCRAPEESIADRSPFWFVLAPKTGNVGHTPRHVPVDD